MGRYCIKCGKETDETSEKCPFCGAVQDMAQTAKKSDPLVGIVAVISTVLIVIIVALNLTIFNNEYKKPLDNMFRAIETGDGEYLEEAFPEYLTDELVDTDDAASSLKAAMTVVLGEDFEISYEIKEKEKINKNTLEKLEDRINKDYDENISISGGYVVEVELEFSGNKEKTTTDKIKVYRINGDWHLTENITEGLF